MRSHRRLPALRRRVSAPSGAAALHLAMPMRLLSAVIAQVLDHLTAFAGNLAQIAACTAHMLQAVEPRIPKLLNRQPGT